jgi:hypothetical protein
VHSALVQDISLVNAGAGRAVLGLPELLWFGGCVGGLEQRVSQPVYAWFLPLFLRTRIRRLIGCALRLRAIVVPPLIIIGFVAISARAPVQ